MTFTEKQSRALKKKLSYLNVKTRSSNGEMIAYVEGWHVIAEANRIFGHDSWDRTTLSPNCHWSEMRRGEMVCFYSTKVRISVRAGKTVIVREGIGTGLGRSSSIEIAHEIALKAAETDATKRALSTFGNPFGLALYDKTKAQVTKPQKKASNAVMVSDTAQKTDPVREFILRDGKGHKKSFSQINEFVDATLNVIPNLETIDAIYAFWDANNKVFAVIRSKFGDPELDPIPAIHFALKARARLLGRSNRLENNNGRNRGAKTEVGLPDKSQTVNTRPKDRRIRDKAHLRFVGKQPCLICGRRPSHAHHLRFAQPRAMASKVSDEFTVPLCSAHHDQLHRVGDERAWWARHGIIEPLKIAAKLWSAADKSEKHDPDCVSTEPEQK